MAFAGQDRNDLVFIREEMCESVRRPTHSISSIDAQVVFSKSQRRAAEPEVY